MYCVFLKIKNRIHNKMSALYFFMLNMKKNYITGGAIMGKRFAMKKMISTAIAGAMVLSFAACGSDNSDKPEQDSEGGSVTLEFQQWWGVELPEGVLEDICNDFTEETGIKIDLLSNPYADTKTQIAAGAAAGTMADIVGLDGAWVYDFAKQGSVANLTERMKDANYDDSQLLDQIQFEGNTYMIPVVNFAYPMYVNTDILSEAGVTEMPATWSEFLDACEKIVGNTDAAAFAIPLSTEAPNGIQNQFMTWLWASGGSMLTEEGKPDLEGNTDLEEVVDFVKEMKEKGYLSDGAEAMKEQDMVNEFENGRLAFMVDGISHLTTIKEEAPNMREKAVWTSLTGESAFQKTANIKKKHGSLLNTL